MCKKLVVKFECGHRRPVTGCIVLCQVYRTFPRHPIDEVVGEEWSEVCEFCLNVQAMDEGRPLTKYEEEMLESYDDMVADWQSSIDRHNYGVLDWNGDELVPDDMCPAHKEQTLRRIRGEQVVHFFIHSCTCKPIG